MIHNFITWSHHALAPPGWCQNCRRSWTSLGLSAWTWTQRAPWGTAGGCWRRSGRRSTASCLRQRWLFVLMIPVYFITHIAVFPNTCILFSYSVAQKQVKLSVLCNAHFNNGTQSNFHTAAVSVVVFLQLARLLWNYCAMPDTAWPKSY